MSILVRMIVSLNLFLAFAGPSWGRDKEYEGADAGFLVYAVGNTTVGIDFQFPYRQVSEGASQRNIWKGQIEPRLGGGIYLKIKNPDFVGEESGHVIVRKLPPGKYEVGSFAFFGSNLAGTSYRWSPSKPFALPFAIRTGEATYIGSFVRAPSLGTRLQPILGAAGYFVVADRQARDFPIASGRLPASIQIVSEVTDVSQFRSEVMRTRHP